MKNSIKRSVLALSFLAFFAISANAQESEPKTVTYGSGIRLSVGADAGLPVGNFSNAYKWSIGGSVQADFPIIQDQFYYTVNAGFNNVFADNSNTGPDLQLIPVKAGLKYFPVKNFYVQGEAGATFVTNKSDAGFSKSTTFAYAPQIGYLFNVGNRNSLDVGFKYENTSKFYDGGSSNGLLGLRVAYSFGL
ncbi:Outer membrane protein beta-barrel domain-containing protein [Pedobacter westerhofensis]|uniref:Outer membrane protein beta-barrel domain-containing protein n=1 Tax=Pedobacter westerhofensis TaxID=425512 RepID=A0A521CL65_9SPHI|nr:outer membrane beta-barrel protein [Pedobacter westerhofensis]SMO60182.1 Outer membrane protein beta-barrel domain-containing protein [Pedobacter westerhofensis]